MTHDLKFNGVSPCEVLQALQAHRLKGIASKYLTAFEVDLHVHVKEVGWFWKNPRIIEDATIIPEALESKLSLNSFLILLPHLEPWVTKHIAQTTPDETVRIRRTLDAGGIVFISGSSLRRDVGPPFPGLFYSLDAIKTRRSLPHPQGALIEMIESAPENCWYISVGFRSSQWFLVNYVERMIFSSLDSVLCTWDDVWDPDSWKVDGYGTLADYWSDSPKDKIWQDIEEDRELERILHEGAEDYRIHERR
jgi:hypothetical protein